MMRPRHWQAIFKVLSQPWHASATFTLRQLGDFGVYDKRVEISEVSAR